MCGVSVYLCGVCDVWVKVDVSTVGFGWGSKTKARGYGYSTAGAGTSLAAYLRVAVFGPACYYSFYRRGVFLTKGTVHNYELEDM